MTVYWNQNDIVSTLLLNKSLLLLGLPCYQFFFTVKRQISSLSNNSVLHSTVTVLKVVLLQTIPFSISTQFTCQNSTISKQISLE